MDHLSSMDASFLHLETVPTLIQGHRGAQSSEALIRQRDHDLSGQPVDHAHQPALEGPLLES